jgi:hypothetical protein
VCYTRAAREQQGWALKERRGQLAQEGIGRGGSAVLASKALSCSKALSSTASACLPPLKLSLRRIKAAAVCRPSSALWRPSSSLSPVPKPRLREMRKRKREAVSKARGR